VLPDIAESPLWLLTERHQRVGRRADTGTDMSISSPSGNSFSPTGSRKRQALMTDLNADD